MQYAEKKLFNKDVPLISLTSEELDRFAWEAICSWPSKAGMNVIHEGLDYSEMTKWFLWDKVGKAIRKEVDPESFADEINHFSMRSAKKDLLHQSNNAVRSSTSNLAGLITQIGTRIRTGLLHFCRNKKVVYVPKAIPHIESAAAALTKRRSVHVFTRPTDLAGFSDAYKLPNPFKLPPPNLEFSDNLFNGILRGLRSFGIELLDEDAKHLHHQILNQSRELKLIEYQIKRLRPDAIFVHSDNHTPVLDAVLIGRREGIPSIMLQHGLDCERYYLDEAYASDIAVWGKDRKDRYNSESKWKPHSIEVVGCPDFDHFRLPEHIDTSGSYWLWVTRPHISERCYAPSRRPEEGLEIFKSLLEALSLMPNERLIIKPHPFDYWGIYSDYIASSNVADRVELSSSNIHDLIPKASVVISEDSTAGLEAMFYGKVVLHAHFAETKPTMRFLEYGAALPGYSTEMILDSLKQIQHLSQGDKRKILQGQQAFLTNHAGPCDGQSTSRFCSFISDVIS